VPTERLLEFTVPGTPHPKERPRHSAGRTYTPATTLAAEEVLLTYFMVARNGGRLQQVFPIRKPKNVRLEVDAFVPNNRTRDWDNIGKLVSDALNKHAYEDDAQVKEAEVKIKIDRENPRTIIRVFALEEDPV
jgi:Holliday junction resolvase RusA-like endonuclease